MTLIFETDNFIVDSVEKPHLDRNDGGHIIISPKIRVVDRQQLSPIQAIELMRLTIVVGEVMKKVMNKNGVDVGRINYQDNGNWSVFNPEGPYLHIHVYGRAKSAEYQKYGKAIFLPLREDNPEYYARFTPLTREDVEDIRTEIAHLFRSEKYSDKKWNISV